MSYALSITFYGNTSDDLNKAVAAYLTSAGSGTVVTGTVADAASRAAGSTATTVKAKTAAQKKAEADAAKAAEAAAAEADDIEIDGGDDIEIDEDKTIDDLRTVLSELKSKSSDPKVLGTLMGEYGVKKVSELPADKYNEIWNKASALLKKAK